MISSCNGTSGITKKKFDLHSIILSKSEFYMSSDDEDEDYYQDYDHYLDVSLDLRYHFAKLVEDYERDLSQNEKIQNFEINPNINRHLTRAEIELIEDLCSFFHDKFPNSDIDVI
jgi:hypothetical protein